MNAPDKIYVFQHGINAFDPLWHFTESKEKYTESHEYISKDSLLEWAKEMRKIAEEQSDNIEERYFKGCSFAYDQLIEKLQSL